MDRIFMDEYYEHLRADNIEAFSKERNDEYVGRAEEYKAAKSALLEGLGLEHLFDHSHELTPKEKEIFIVLEPNLLMVSNRCLDIINDIVNLFIMRFDTAG